MDGGRGEGQEEEKIGHAAAQAARSKRQRIKKCDRRGKVTEEMERSAAKRSVSNQSRRGSPSNNTQANTIARCSTGGAERHAPRRGNLKQSKTE
jgi:hypothetical protein